MASLTVNAGTGVNDNSVGTLAWNAGTLNAIAVADGTAAYTQSTTAGQITNRIRIPFSSLSSIPVGATITGIGVMLRMDCYSAFSRTAVDTGVQLLIGDVLVGSNKGGGVTLPASFPTDVFVNYTYGGATDLWGTGDGEITRASLLAATNLLAVYFTYGSGAGSTYAQIDHATMTVYYTAGGGGLAGGGLAGGGGLVNGGLVTCS